MIWIISYESYHMIIVLKSWRSASVTSCNLLSLLCYQRLSDNFEELNWTLYNLSIFIYQFQTNIDRPKQKTFTIVFLVVTMLFTMMLGIVEFASIGIGNYFKAFANRHQDITKGFGLRIRNYYLKIVYQWICIFFILVSNLWF